MNTIITPVSDNFNIFFKHDSSNFRFYNFIDYRPSAHTLDTHVRLINRIRERLSSNPRFLPHLGNSRVYKRNNRARSEIREKSAFVLSHLCHHVDFRTYSDSGTVKTFEKNQFTLDSLSKTLKISWSSLQRTIKTLITDGYLIANYKYWDRGKSSTQFSITGKLFSHLGFLADTLLKSAKNAINSHKSKKEHHRKTTSYMDKNYASKTSQIKNKNLGILNQSTDQKNTENNQYYLQKIKSIIGK